MEFAFLMMRWLLGLHMLVQYCFALKVGALVKNAALRIETSSSATNYSLQKFMVLFLRG